MVAMHCYHMRQVYGFLELSCGGNALLPMRQVYGFLELPCGGNALLPMRQVYGFLELPCGGNALLPHEASLWILGVASCGGNALLPHEASLWILGVALWWQCIATTTTGKNLWTCLELWWQCIATMRQVYGFLELPHVVAMHCYNEASLWILGVASCGGNALLPHEASLWILGVALWWQCIVTT